MIPLMELTDSGRTVVKSRTAEPAVRLHLTLVVSRKADIYRRTFTEPRTSGHGMIKPFRTLNKSERFTPGFICGLYAFGRSLPSSIS